MLIEVLRIAALLNGVDPDILVSVCTVETNIRNVINHHDGGSPSFGLCQIKVSTARMIEPDITHHDLMVPKHNARVAAKYLKRQLERYDGDIKCAVAAYNAGSCKKNSNGVIRNVRYVKKVMNVYGSL